MIHAHEPNDDELTPAYAGRLNQRPTPKHRLPDSESPPAAVYRFIHDELLLDGSSRLNMATFVTTWMEPEAEKLMAESFDKNMIDKDEYPRPRRSSDGASTLSPTCSTRRPTVTRSACRRSGRARR